MRLLIAILLLLVTAPALAQSQNLSEAMVVSSCGGGALPSGSMTQLTMNPAGQLCLTGLSGGGASCPAAANAYLARTVGGNEGGNATPITNLICGLVTDGVWDKLDALYVLGQQNATDALLNLKGTSYTLNNPGGLAFTPYVGFGFFSAPAMNTGFNPATAVGAKFTQNSGSISGWAYASTTGTLLGGVNASGANDVFPNFFGSFYCDVNSAAVTVANIAAPGTAGLYACDRSTASTVDFYLNGSSIFSGAQTSVPPVSTNLIVASRVADAAFGDYERAASIGASLGAAGQAALYNRLNTYFSALLLRTIISIPKPLPQPIVPERK